jgi:hypothetical protein
MNLFSLLGVEIALPGGKRKGAIKKFDAEVHHYENKEMVSRNTGKFDNSSHWTVDSQFWG